MSANKYPCIFPHQMDVIVYLLRQIRLVIKGDFKDTESHISGPLYRHILTVGFHKDEKRKGLPWNNGRSSGSRGISLGTHLGMRGLSLGVSAKLLWELRPKYGERVIQHCVHAPTCFSHVNFGFVITGGVGNRVSEFPALLAAALKWNTHICQKRHVWHLLQSWKIQSCIFITTFLASCYRHLNFSLLFDRF